MRAALSFLLLPLFLGQGNATPRRAHRLGALQNQQLGDGDCGCEITIGKGGDKRKIFVVDALHDDGSATANIDGKDVLLRRSGARDESAHRVGQHYSETWIGDSSLIVKIDYRVTKTCGHGLPTEDAGCEGVDLAALLTVSDGKTTETVKGAGYCGC